MTWKTYGTEPPEQIVAIDFESYYDDEVSLRKMSAWSYTWHPQVEPYLISIVGHDFEWVGNPKDFVGWDRLTGKVVVAHNMAFDKLFFDRLKDEGVIPETCRPARFACTADCTAYMRSKRSLQAAVKNFFGEDISKKVREDAKGKTGDELKASPEKWEAMLAYGLDDSRWCRRIAVEKFPEWPAVEQRASELNRMSADAGIHVDMELLESGIADLEELLFGYGKVIPWYPEEPALSSIAVRAQGRKDGIKVPGSLAKSTPEGEAFYQKYKDEFPWVAAIRHYRSTNALLAKLKTLRDGVRPDGTFPYTSTYFGAHSGRLTAGVKRDSSQDDVGGAFNLYNLPRGEIQGVNLRTMLVPPPGHVFVIADYAQVEARVVLWLSGDTHTIDLIKQGYNVYEAAATKILRREDTKGLKKEDPKTYAFVKATVLGANYNMGGPRFKDTAPVLTGGEFAPDDEEAARAIAQYRAANPSIVGQWHRHQAALMSSAINGDDTHRVELPSGRWITYYDPVYANVDDKKTGKIRRELLAKQVLGDSARRLYGGKIFENISQSVARDILRDAWVALVDAGYVVNWTVYDEFIIPLPIADDYAEKIADIHRIMTTSSPWAEGLPLDTEIDIATHYKK